VLPVAGLVISAVLVPQAPAPRDTLPRARLTALPVVSYSDVTGVQYGATVFRGFRVGADQATRSSSLAFYAARTAKHHTKAYVQLDRWGEANRARLRLRIEHISYPLPFFGVGASTPDSAEEWYSSGVSTAQLFLQRAIRPSTFIHGGVRYVRSRMRDVETGGMLAQQSLPGSSGSDVVTAELGLVIDSRDNTGSARTGTYVRALPSIASKATGSDFVFRRLTIDARRYGVVLSRHVIAAQVQYDGISGTAPFDQLPMIGSDTAMRGYPRGRFRDQHAITAQAELRTAPWRRVGAVAFAGGGTVASAFSKVGRERWYPTAGVGLRYVLSPRERMVLRADLGIGQGSFGINVGIGEAF
jgi:hypothetical protein